MNALIKYLTTRYLLWSHRYHDAPLLDFRNAAAQSRRFLIHVPSTYAPPHLAAFLKQLTAVFQNPVVDFLCAADCPDALQQVMKERSAQIHAVSKASLRFFRIIRPEIIQKLKERNFDIVVDLSTSFDVTFAHALRACGAPIVIGRYGGEHPQIFHNLWVKTSNPTLYSDHVCRCLAQLKA